MRTTEILVNFETNFWNRGLQKYTEGQKKKGSLGNGSVDRIYTCTTGLLNIGGGIPHRDLPKQELKSNCEDNSQFDLKF